MNSPEYKKEELPVIIGIGVVVERNGKILFLKRKGIHGEGEWALPGGRVQFGETFANTGLRELQEETGIVGQSAQVISLSNQRRYLEDGIHCVIIGVSVKVSPGAEPEIKETGKCEALGWFSLDELPERIFEGSEQIIAALCGEGKQIPFIEEG